MLMYLLTAALALLLISVLLPSKTGGQPNPRAVCRYNLRMICQGALQYANGNTGQFPASLQALVGGGALNNWRLVCPELRHAPPACDYYYVAGLTTDDPRDWIVGYEDPVHQRRQGANVLYRDGRVAYLKKPQFAQELQRFKVAYEQARGCPPTISPPK